MNWALLAAVTGLLTCSHSKCEVSLPPVPAPTYWADGVEKPPAAFDHQPMGEWVILHVSAPEIQAFCGHNADACTKQYFFDGPGRVFCLTVLQNKYPDGTSASEIWHHERAHCNGWIDD